MQLLSRARIEEIRSICSLTSNEIDEELAALKEYHLYSARDTPVSGTVLEIPEPIRLMHDVTSASLIKQRRDKIASECARIRKNETDPGRSVALVISQTVTYWKAQQYDLAISYLGEEINKHKRAGELYCLRARTRMMKGRDHYKQADEDFVLAERFGCDKFALLKHWSSLKVRIGDWRGVCRVIERTDGAFEHPIICVCLAYATMKRAEKAIDAKSTSDALVLFKEAVAKSSEFIEKSMVYGYYFQLRGIMHQCSNSYIESLKKRGNVDDMREIFDFVSWCVSKNFAATSILVAGFSCLREWLSGFNHDLPSATRKRLADQLHDIRRYLTGQQAPRHRLISRCDDLLRMIEIQSS
jgi:hypothetical protein